MRHTQRYAAFVEDHYEIISLATAKALGLRHYFTGEPCKNGHIGDRLTRSRACVICSRMNQRNRRRSPAAREHDRIYAKIRRESDPEKAREEVRQWRRLNPAKVRKYKKKWNSENAEKAAGYVTEAHRRWRLRDPAAAQEFDVMHRHKRRARKMDLPSTFSRADWRSLVSRSPRCHWCKRRFNMKRRPTHDHVVPLVKGGPNTLENSCCACAECNSGKGSRLINPVTGQGILL